METHKTVSRDEWLAARTELLAKEKDFTRLRDRLSAERRALPWVKVEKAYVFDTAERQGNARRSVRRTQPADGRSFHARPRLGARAASAARSSADHIGGLVHLEHHDVSVVVGVARAARRDRSLTKAAWAGASTGCRLAAATSTSITTCRSPGRPGKRRGLLQLSRDGRRDRGTARPQRVLQERGRGHLPYLFELCPRRRGAASPPT